MDKFRKSIRKDNIETLKNSQNNFLLYFSPLVIYIYWIFKVKMSHIQRLFCFIASFALLFFSVPQNIYSQKLNKKAIKKNLSKAEEAFYNQNFRGAINFYTALDTLVDAQDKDYVNYQLGLCYLYSNIDNEKALKNIRLAENGMKESEIADLFYYHLGLAYHVNEEFDEAIKAYKVLDEMELYSEDLAKEIETQKEISENAKKQTQLTSIERVLNAGININSIFPDYKPVISADESVLIFTSRRELTPGATKDIDGKYFENIYIVTKDEYGYWTVPKGISSNINTTTHEASVGLSPDGNELILYRGNPDAGGLYVSKLIGSEWSLPSLLDNGNGTINAKKSWETSGSKTADGKTIYFTSDRKGTFGGLDLYRSDLDANGNWTTPVNLGPEINTRFDEKSPFIHPDGKTLYFSTKGHNSLGGYDIFKSTLTDDKWTTPVNLGFPVNSAADDIHFVLTANGKKAYYSSSRKGSIGEQDIYKAILEEEIAPLILVKGIVKTEDTGMVQVAINVMDKLDGQAQKYIYNPNPKTGKYLMILPAGRSYDMIVSAQGYDPYAVDIAIPNQTEFHELYQEITLKKINAFGKEVGQEIVVVNSFNNTRKLTDDNDAFGKQAEPEYLLNLVEQIVKKADEQSLDNLANSSDPTFLADIEKLNKITDNAAENFEKVKEEKLYTEAMSGKHYYTTEGKAELKPLKLGNQTVMVVPAEKMKKTELSQPTDTKIDNQDLIAVNSTKETAYALPASKVDKELIKELNLTQEIKNGDTTYIVPDELIALSEKPLPKKQDDIAQNNQTKTNKVPKDIVDKNSQTEIAQYTGNTTLPSEKSQNQQSVIVEKMVNFGFDQTDITDSYRADLDVVIDMMTKYPDYKLEITGHTDSKGSSVYNMRLSQERAQKVANYLLSKGIKKSQLLVKGYGEERPIAPNSNPDGTDNEIGRSQNRRTEIRLKG